ncbi:insulinase family protein [Streptomyces sp. NPDC051582]|uniref:M16 family metallopeptidase n=1 Tax=Streptomyces sp. NPDC051582 TaxID=3155167 RepID=UPI00343BEA52
MTMSNGLRCVVVPDSTAPLVEIRMYIPCPTAGEAHAAATHILSDVLLHAAGGQTGEHAQAWAVADIDSARNAEWIGVFGYAPAASLPSVLREIGRHLAEPRFSDASIAEARDRLAAQVAIRRGEPRWMALTTLLRRCRTENTMPHELPSPAALRGVEPGAVRSLQSSSLTPHGAILVLVGEVQGSSVAALMEEAFSGWRRDEAPQDLPALPSAAADEVVLVHRPQSAQAELLMMSPGLHRTHARRPALDIANAVFGAGVASRLAMNIRERKGYAYMAGSATEMVAGSPTTVVRLAANEATAALALRDTRAELAAMISSPPTDEEIAVAKRLLAGRIATALVSPSAHATLLANLLSEGVGPEWMDDYPLALAAVGAGDVVGAALHHFDPKGFDTVVIGNATALAVSLADVPGTTVRRFERIDDVPHGLPAPSPLQRSDMGVSR